MATPYNTKTKQIAAGGSLGGYTDIQLLSLRRQLSQSASGLNSTQRSKVNIALSRVKREIIGRRAQAGWYADTPSNIPTAGMLTPNYGTGGGFVQGGGTPLYVESNADPAPATGGIDTQTMLIIGGVGVLALVLLKRKRR